MGKSKPLELTGQRFGRLIVITRTKNHKGNQTRWLCQCSCGNTINILGRSLTSGHTKSCGCFHRDCVTKHGHSTNGVTTKTYTTWLNIHARCTNSKATGYKYWGGRGIKVCERWSKFENFLADMGESPKGLTIERKDNDKDYSLDNCKWATYKEQAQNRRNINAF